VLSSHIDEKQKSVDFILQGGSLAKKKKKTKKNKHKIWEGSLVENSLRKLTSYSQGCMEIILKWRDIFGVYVKGQS